MHETKCLFNLQQYDKIYCLVNREREQQTLKPLHHSHINPHNVHSLWIGQVWSRRAFYNKVTVVLYCDQQTGALHTICWSQSSFSAFAVFFIQLLEKKEKNGVLRPTIRDLTTQRQFKLRSSHPWHSYHISLSFGPPIHDIN